MKIPSTLKVGAHRIKVTQPEQIERDNDGVWLSGSNEIQVRRGLPQSQKEATFLHEIIHCLNINIPEIDVEYLSQGIYQVLVDNKLSFDGKDEE